MLRTAGPVNTLCFSLLCMCSHLLICAMYRSSTARPCLALSKPDAARTALSMASVALVLQRKNKQLFLVPQCRIGTKLEIPQKQEAGLNKEILYHVLQKQKPTTGNTKKQVGEKNYVLVLSVFFSDLLITNEISIVHCNLLLLSWPPSLGGNTHQLFLVSFSIPCSFCKTKIAKLLACFLFSPQQQRKMFLIVQGKTQKNPPQNKTDKYKNSKGKTKKPPNQKEPNHLIDVNRFIWEKCF